MPDTAALEPQADSSQRWPSDLDLANIRSDVSSFAEAHGVSVSPEDVRVAVAPYRVCPLGAHVDHQGGCVLGVALDCGVLLGFVPTPNANPIYANGADRNEAETLSPTEVLLCSDAFAGDVRFDVRDPFDEVSGAINSEENTEAEDSQLKSTNTWSAFARGAATVLADEFKNNKKTENKKLTSGCIGVARSFPIGVRMDGAGVSSSAAVTVAMLSAMRNVNGLDGSMDEEEEEEEEERDLFKSNSNWSLAKSARRVENEFVDVKCGILDQASICLSRRNKLTVIDCAQRTHEHVRFGEQCTIRAGEAGRDVSQGDNKPEGGTEPYKILLAFSGLRKALTNTGYNGRVEECHEAASQLLQGDDTIKDATSSKNTLSDVSIPLYTSRRDTLPPSLRKRATHFFQEVERVRLGKNAWASGDLSTFGKLMTKSGVSSVENYECGCTPMNALREIVCHTNGVYGGRFSGAGFRGCVVAICDSNLAEQAAESIVKEYQSKHPELAADAKVLLANTGDGARVI